MKKGAANSNAGQGEAGVSEQGATGHSTEQRDRKRDRARQGSAAGCSTAQRATAARWDTDDTQLGSKHYGAAGRHRNRARR
jgi:ribosome assembly protein YihI (activator of Der GTPase)